MARHSRFHSGVFRCDYLVLDEAVDLVHLIQSLFGPALAFDDRFNFLAKRPNAFG